MTLLSIFHLLSFIRPNCSPSKQTKKKADFAWLDPNGFYIISVNLFKEYILSRPLVKPLKKGQMSIADKYRTAIRNMPNISNIKFDAEIGFMPGSPRANYGLPLPDMLQVAAALAQPANAIITNDRDIQRV
jgi:hypothetical protein